MLPAVLIGFYLWLAEEKSTCPAQCSTVLLLSAERADYVLEPIKSRDAVPKTILGGSTLAMCTHFPSKLLLFLSLLADVATLSAILFSFNLKVWVEIGNCQAAIILSCRNRFQIVMPTRRVLILDTVVSNWTNNLKWIGVKFELSILIVANETYPIWTSAVYNLCITYCILFFQFFVWILKCDGEFYLFVINFMQFCFECIFCKIIKLPVLPVLIVLFMLMYFITSANHLFSLQWKIKQLIPLACILLSHALSFCFAELAQVRNEYQV